MWIYFSQTSYPGKKSTGDIVQDIADVDAIITVLKGAALEAAANAHLTAYNFNDQQTQMRMEYKSVESIVASIKSMMSLRALYVQMLPGYSRVVRFIDGKNMIPNPPYMP